jgi:hypothetical protein
MKTKTKEQKEGFSMGLLTMLLASIGVDLFGQGSWVTYLGLSLIILAAVNVWKYARKPKQR